MKWWDGTTLQTIEDVTWWDGNSKQSATVQGWWDGTTVQSFTDGGGGSDGILSYDLDNLILENITSKSDITLEDYEITDGILTSIIPSGETFSIFIPVLGMTLDDAIAVEDDHIFNPTIAITSGIHSGELLPAVRLVIDGTLLGGPSSMVYNLTLITSSPVFKGSDFTDTVNFYGQYGLVFDFDTALGFGVSNSFFNAEESDIELSIQTWDGLVTLDPVGSDGPPSVALGEPVGAWSSGMPHSTNFERFDLNAFLIEEFEFGTHYEFSSDVGVFFGFLYRLIDGLELIEGWDGTGYFLWDGGTESALTTKWIDEDLHEAQIEYFAGFGITLEFVGVGFAIHPDTVTPFTITAE